MLILALPVGMVPNVPPRMALSSAPAHLDILEMLILAANQSAPLILTALLLLLASSNDVWTLALGLVASMPNAKL